MLHGDTKTLKRSCERSDLTLHQFMVALRKVTVCVSAAVFFQLKRSVVGETFLLTIHAAIARL